MDTSTKHDLITLGNLLAWYVEYHGAQLPAEAAELAAAWNRMTERLARERVGACEWCGTVDHHLLDGECPRCRTRTQDYDGVPLGVEAAEVGELDHDVYPR